MTMARIVAPETLDALAQDDPAAMRSRRDLRRVHRAMGTRAIIVRALWEMHASRHASHVTTLRVLELGAGDGSLMLGVASALGSVWSNVELTLLDRQSLVDASTIARYAALGWTATPQTVDVLDWAARNAAPTDNAAGDWDLIVANLFLHHFEAAELAAVLAAIAASSKYLFACEPRRAWLALAGSQLIGVIGANAVTREDAVLSVHAGFRDKELTNLWPAHGGEWSLREYPAGLFSHCFRAQRVK